MKISEAALDTWASTLLDYSLGGIEPDDVVMVKGEHITWPLMKAVQEKIIQAGATPDIYLVPPDNDRGKVWGASMARHGSVDQIRKVPAWLETRYRNMTKYIEILGAETPDEFADLPDELSQEVMRADELYKTIRLEKPWVLTLFPTQAFADLEEMSLDEYTDLLVIASTVDPTYLDEVEDDIHRLMSEAKNVRILTRNPNTGATLELTMDIGGRNIVKCTGHRNFPDGEVFTSPTAHSVQGEIFVDLPVFYAGATIQGIYLKFEEGRIVEYAADKGGDALKKIIETDEGSHRLGEVAFGMNQGIQRALKHPLFVEKVGGTMHIAIGASYPECYLENPEDPKNKEKLDDLAKQGILNRSAQHVDIVTDFRPGGCGVAVFLDDAEVVVKKGIWVPAS